MFKISRISQIEHKIVISEALEERNSRRVYSDMISLSKDWGHCSINHSPFRALCGNFRNMEHFSPPRRHTRAGHRLAEAAEKLEEEQNYEACPWVMMVGKGEEVRQRHADKVHDERRRELDAIERGDGVPSLKKEVLAEEMLREPLPDCDVDGNIGDGEAGAWEQATALERLSAAGPAPAAASPISSSPTASRASSTKSATSRPTPPTMSSRRRRKVPGRRPCAIRCGPIGCGCAT